jgi:glutathione S-transferase
MSTSTSIPADTKVILHWLDKSRSQRILFLLEELSIPYELRVYKRGSDKLAPPELKAVHPLGKSPVIEIQTAGRKPIVIAESALIVEYLCDYWGKSLIPNRFENSDGAGDIGQETEAWMRYKYYLNYAEGSLMPYMVMKLVISSMPYPPPSFV